MTTPYADGAPAYAAAGFTGMFPVRGKRPALSGVTGRLGTQTTPEYYMSLAPDHMADNIGWRLPSRFVGVDVDAYGTKQGAVTMAVLTAQLGPLPATVTTTARGSGPSRISLFRIPEGAELSGALEARHADGSVSRDVEVVQHHHRYAVVWPSVHPGTGGIYRWYAPDGTALDGPPDLSAVPSLPDAWLAHFGQSSERSSPGLGEGEAHFRSTYTGSAFPEALESALGRFTASPGSRHDTMLTTLHQCAREAAAGAYPAALAFDRLRDLWDAATGDESRSPVEFSEMVRTACEAVSPESVAAQREKLARFWEVRQAPALEAFDAPVPGGGEDQTHLPASFWAARPVLTHIRDAAHSRLFGADAVFYGVLARLASMVPPALRVDTGILSPVSLNLAVAVVAASGIGKSTGESRARDVIPAPGYLTDHGYGDGLPLGSGEGLAESYFGTVEEDAGDATRHGDDQPKGKPKMIRRKVRDNNFFVLDEGTALMEMLARQGTTIGSALRSAVSGSTIGQQNARAETTRVLEGGSYSAGFLIGFQPRFAGALFTPEFVAAGTPQRFLYAKASDPSIPADSPADPGPLPVAAVLRDVVTRPSANPFGDLSLPKGEDVPVIGVPEVEQRRIRAERLEILAGADTERDELDSQQPAMLAKLAGLLAVLDGRTDTTDEDWVLAGTVWSTSCAVRDQLRGIAEAERQKETQGRVEFHAKKEAAAALQVDEARASVTDAKVSRLALKIAGWVHRGEGTAWRAFAATVAGRDKRLLPDARDLAVTNGWIVYDSPTITPGPSRPTAQEN